MALSLRGDFELGLLSNARTVKTMGPLVDGLNTFCILYFEMVMSLWDPGWDIMVWTWNSPKGSHVEGMVLNAAKLKSRAFKK